MIGKRQDSESRSQPESTRVDSANAPIAPPPVSSRLSSNQVAEGVLVSKRSLLALGIAIGATAIIGFGLGFLFGSTSASSDQATAQGPFSVSGRVESHASALIILLPESMRPDRKMEFSKLLVTMEDGQNSPERQQIEQLGGACVLSDDEGQFRAQVGHADSYFVFAILRSAANSSPEPTTKTLAELGRYFLRGHEILNRVEYEWIRQRIDRDVKISISL